MKLQALLFLTLDSIPAKRLARKVGESDARVSGGDGSVTKDPIRQLTTMAAALVKSWRPYPFLDLCATRTAAPHEQIPKSALQPQSATRNAALVQGRNGNEQEIVLRKEEAHETVSILAAPLPTATMIARTNACSALCVLLARTRARHDCR